MKYQLQYYLIGILTLPIFPVFLILGLIAKKKTGKLPDAVEPEGTLHGEEPPLRLTVVGESTVAGVGVKHHSDGVSFHIARFINTGTSRKVSWEAVGGTGFNVKKVEKLLVPRIENHDSTPDLIAILSGGNDTLELTSPLKWKKGMEKLVESIRRRFPDSRIVIANLPPIRTFPSFHPLLQWYLGTLNEMHRLVIKDLPEKYPNLDYMVEEIDFDQWRNREGRNIEVDEFFSDGVHPSALTYRLWGEEIAERLLDSNNQ